MTPLYFVPFDGINPALVPPNRVEKLPDNIMEKYGLSYLAGVPINCKTDDGPDNKKGFMFTPAARFHGQVSTALSYDPEDQTWAKIYNGEQFYWYGFYNDSKPKPIDLQREQKPTVGGHLVKMKDGNEWIVPVLTPNYTTLPLRWVRRDGVIIHEVEQAWQWACELSLVWYDRFINRAETSWLYGEMLEYAAKVLSINYLLAPDEILGDALNLLDWECFQNILDVTFGGREVRAEVEAKKKAEQPQDT